MMLAKDPAKQKAAWEFMKFATGPQGATIMVKSTGYLPRHWPRRRIRKMLRRFYEENPNHLVALDQLPVVPLVRLSRRERRQDHRRDQGPPANGGQK